MNNPIVAARKPSYRPLLSAILCGLLLGVAAAAGTPGCSGGAIGGSTLTDDGGTGTGTGGTDDSGTGTGTGGGGTGDDGGQAAYCAGQGPPIIVGDSGGSSGRCTGNIAASAFRYGLCMCQGLSSGAPITVDAFDSSNASATAFGAGGSVGCDSNINVSNQMSLVGTLQVAGSVNNSGTLGVGLDTLVGSSFADDQSITIGRNAQVNGDVRCNGQLKITGSLTYPTGKTLTASNPSIGSTVRAPVTVASPCDCSTPFDVASYVQQRQTVNDNAAIGLDPAMLNNYAGDQVLNLTCGRFYLNTINGNGKVNLNITGRTALFVGSDVNLSSSLTVTLGGGGELDLFINGGLTSSAPLNFGNKDTPARVRLYMGGSRNINLSAGSVLGGNVYAPQSSLVTSGTLEVFGALFVGSFNPSAAVKIHHDIAILNSSQECGTTGTGGTAPSCNSCSDCGGQACSGGKCGACNTSADCCSPLSCVRNKCVFQIG